MPKCVKYYERDGEKYILRWEKTISAWSANCRLFPSGGEKDAAISTCGRYVVANTSKARMTQISIWDERGNIVLEKPITVQGSIQKVSIKNYPIRVMMGLSNLDDYDLYSGGYSNIGFCVLNELGEILWHYPYGEVNDFVFSSDGYCLVRIDGPDYIVLLNAKGKVLRKFLIFDWIFSTPHSTFFALSTTVKTGWEPGPIGGNRRTWVAKQDVQIFASSLETIGKFSIKGPLGSITIDESTKRVGFSYYNPKLENSVVSILEFRRSFFNRQYAKILMEKKSKEILSEDQASNGIEVLRFYPEGLICYHSVSGLIFLRMNGEIDKILSVPKIDTSKLTHKFQNIIFSEDLKKAILVHWSN